MNRKLAAAFAAVWEAEMAMADRIARAAEIEPSSTRKVRLTMEAAFCRAHAARCKARLEALGAKMMPVPSEPGEPDLLRDAQFARKMADRYDALGKESRAACDVSSAWVCELNRAEKLECAEKLEAA